MSEKSASAETIGVKQWLLVACLLLFYILSVIDRNGIAMVIDPIKADLHISDTQMSLLIGIAFALAYAVGGIPMGWLVDRFSRRWMIFSSITMWGLATAACGLAGTFGQLFLARLAVGVSESPLHPASHSIISDTFPRKRMALVISIYSMGAVIGAGLALILGGMIVDALLHAPPVSLPIVGVLASWQLVFVAMGLPCLLLGGLILLFAEPPRRGRLASAKGASWSAFFAFLRLRWRLLTCFTIAFGGMQTVNGAFIFWQPAYLSRAFHLTPAQYGLALGLISAVAGVIGLLFSGWAVDRLYARGMRDAHMRYYFWALLLSTPLVLVAVLSDDLRVYFGLIWIAKLLTLNMLGFSSAMIQLISPNELRGRMSAVFVNLVLSFGAAAFGPLVPALISDHLLHDNIHLGRALAVTMAIFIPAALVALLLGRKPLREAVEAAEGWR